MGGAAPKLDVWTSTVRSSEYRYPRHEYRYPLHQKGSNGWKMSPTAPNNPQRSPTRVSFKLWVESFEGCNGCLLSLEKGKKFKSEFVKSLVGKLR
ncbi:hypothetical protein GQ457_07G000640 [Hibiscus cannabinus]